ncbi:LOW QUALITY PROTEIN: rho GTPase-activating protein 8 [Acridotheres tristis]
MSEVDYEKLAEVEQKKDEMDDTHSEQEETFLHPPPEDPELNISHPYHDVVRHGITLTGDDNSGRKVITFNCCCMSPSHQLNHTRLLEYLKYTLDQYVENYYTVVYFHYDLKSLKKMSLKWLQTAYQEFDRKYKKNLKALYVVHPTNFIKILWNIFKPLISLLFGKKITCLNYLGDLGEHLKYPSRSRHDENHWRKQKGLPPVIKVPPPQPPLPTQQFGVSLQYMKDKNKGKLVPLLKKMISYLKSRGLEVEDLFRISIQTTKDVQKLYNQGKSLNFDDYQDIHTPAVILKTFLRELPQPLLTFDSFDHILEITSILSLTAKLDHSNGTFMVNTVQKAALKRYLVFLTLPHSVLTSSQISPPHFLTTSYSSARQVPEKM